MKKPNEPKTNVSEASRFVMVLQNKPKYPHFQPKIKGCPKNKPNSNPGGTYKRSLWVFVQNKPNRDRLTMKKRNEPKMPKAVIPNPLYGVRNLLK